MHEGCCINCAAIVEPMTNESRKHRYETMKSISGPHAADTAF